MDLATLIDIADEGYHRAGDSSDGKVKEAFEMLQSGDETNEKRALIGDGLAIFIARELIENFEEEDSTEEKLSRAVDLMDSASEEINNVHSAVEQARFAYVEDM